MKKIFVSLLIFNFVSFLPGTGVAFSETAAAPQSASADEKMKWIFEQHALEEEGRRLERVGDFANALEKYQLASSYGIKIWVGTKLASAPSISNYVIGVLQKQG